MRYLVNIGMIVWSEYLLVTLPILLQKIFPLNLVSNSLPKKDKQLYFSKRSLCILYFVFKWPIPHIFSICSKQRKDRQINLLSHDQSIISLVGEQSSLTKSSKLPTKLTRENLWRKIYFPSICLSVFLTSSAVSGHKLAKAASSNLWSFLCINKVRMEAIVSRLRNLENL